MTKEQVYKNIYNELNDILDSYVIIHTDIREENNMYTVDVSIQGDVDYDFEVSFDGSVEEFADVLRNALRWFNPGENARENIEKYNIWNIDDMRWYIDKAEELEEMCNGLADNLDEYMQSEKENAEIPLF